jgi:hypothetical protein
MTDVTHILSAIERGDPHAAEQHLPLFYDELRRWRPRNSRWSSRDKRFRRPTWSTKRKKMLLPCVLKASARS